MFEKQLRKSDILSKDASVFIGVFIVNFEHISHLVLAFLLLTLDK